MKLAAGLFVLAIAASPSATQAQDAVLGGFDSIIGGKVFVKNNSAASLTCSISKDGSHWGGWFALNPGAEYGAWAYEDDGKFFFRCRAPMKKAIYSLHPGRRYSVLNTGSYLELRDIDTD